MDKDDKKVFWCIGLGFVLFMMVAVASSWYTAGVKADVYRRSGVQVSQWEVFIGATPPERVIHLKE